MAFLKSQALAYSFVALIIVCVLASMFTMSFGLFFATVAVAITVYAVYRMALDRRARNCGADKDGEAETADQDQDQDQDEPDMVFAPAVVQAPPARLVALGNEEPPRFPAGKKKRMMRKPTAEEIEYARLLSKQQQSKERSREQRCMQMRGADLRTDAAYDGKAAGHKFLNNGKKQLHVRRKKPSRRADSSGYAQLASFRYDDSKSLSENVAARMMRQGARLPEPNHARRRLMTSMLRDFPLKLAPGMVRVPEGVDLNPCKWR